MHFVGLDVSKKLTSICVLNSDGIPVAESDVLTDPKQILSFLRGKRRRYAHVGLEAGAITGWLREELARKGLPAICIETRHAHKVLSARMNKTDKNDARGIAELMRLGSFRAVHEKSQESRQIKAVLSARRLLLQKRLDIDGAIRALLLQAGHKPSSSRRRGFESQVLAFARHDPFLTPLLKSLLVARKCIAEQADALSRRASDMATSDPICRRLMTAPGIGVAGDRFGATGARAGNLIVNGSFEADDFGTGGGGQRLGLVGNDVTGWYIPASDGVYPWGLQNVNQYGAGPADSGNQWLILGEVNSATDYTIQQTMHGLTPGKTYTLDFAIASEQGSSGAVGEVSFLNGSSTAAQDFTAPVRGPTYWNPWGHDSMDFVATASDVTVQFKDLAAEFPGGYDLGLDSVSVAGGVPEPATWAMMLLGLGGLGAMMRSQRRAAVAL